VIIRQSPHGSAIHRSLAPEEAEWGINTYLLANVADAVTWLVWAKTEDGSKNQNMPKPIRRPGDVDKPARGISMTEAAKALGWSTTTEAGDG
jgi:hypothetical protein